MALVIACCKGSSKAQFELFEQYKRNMFGICLRFMDNNQDAEDLLQEGFLKVFRDICRFRGEGSLEGWIRKVFIRTALDQVKIKKKIPKTIDFGDFENISMETEVIEISDSEKVIKLMQKMPVGYRTILNLFILEGLSHNEISKEMGIALSTSRSQLARAKSFLKNLINKSMIII